MPSPIRYPQRRLALGVAIKFALAGGLKVKEPVASKPLPLPANGAWLAVS